VVAFFPAEWQRDMASPYLTSGFHNVPWDDPAILRYCIDTLPEPQAATKHQLMALLGLDTAEKTRKPIWHRVFAGN
jgi:hypothetical protein